MTLAACAHPHWPSPRMAALPGRAQERWAVSRQEVKGTGEHPRPGHQGDQDTADSQRCLQGLLQLPRQLRLHTGPRLCVRQAGPRRRDKGLSEARWWPAGASPEALSRGSGGPRPGLCRACWTEGRAAVADASSEGHRRGLGFTVAPPQGFLYPPMSPVRSPGAGGLRNSTQCQRHGLNRDDARYL